MNKKNLSIVIAVVAIVIIIIVVFIQTNLNTAKAPSSALNENSSTTSTLALPSSTTGASTSTSQNSSSSLSVAVQKSYSNSSFLFNYPNSWSIFNYSPFSMNNFNGQYQSGGIIPKGGAEIDVVTTTSYGPVSDIIATELMSSTNIATSSMTVDGVSCSAVNYENSYGDGSASKDTALYCSRGTELWKIYLSYHADDSAANAHITDFQSVLSSMKFLP